MKHRFISKRYWEDRIWEDVKAGKTLVFGDEDNHGELNLANMNKSLNYLRDNAKRMKDSSLQESEALINSLALSSPSVEEEINALELQEFIDRVYLSLPEKVVNTFRLSRQEGLTYNEIAERLGISTKVVEYHISITLRALRLRIGTDNSSIAVHPAKK